jgi:hypothetical protein
MVVHVDMYDRTFDVCVDSIGLLLLLMMDKRTILQLFDGTKKKKQVLRSPLYRVMATEAMVRGNFVVQYRRPT